MNPASPRLGLVFCFALASCFASGKPKESPQSTVPLVVDARLNVRYSETLSYLQHEIVVALPNIYDPKELRLVQAQEAVRKAEAAALEAHMTLGSVAKAKTLVAHAKLKWIADADKNIAKAQADLAAAKTTAEREAAEKELAKWQADRAAGVKAFEERTAAYEKAKLDEPRYKKADEEAKAALAKARDEERKAADEIEADILPTLATDNLDAHLVKGAVLAHATPRGLAEFAGQGPDKAALVNQLLGDTALMKEMLVAGGARYGQYGRAMEIYTAIRKASPQSHSGNLKSLALATSLEHARPIAQSSHNEASDTQVIVDPVKRYLHYEKAFLAGELDPAFQNLSAWEYRHVVNSDAPDEILAWGREMLRNYRPDYVHYPKHGSRYVGSIQTEIPYGSHAGGAQATKYDDPSLHLYQNILRNAGACRRQALYGRFILRAFGIPTWGVTQKEQDSMSHWTPRGWFFHGSRYDLSWWDKDDVPMSGTQFYEETRARADGDAYLRVLRAEWVNRILGEESYNDRLKVTGGFWSNMAHYMTSTLIAKQDALRPHGLKVREDWFLMQKKKEADAEMATWDQEVQRAADGTITIPSFSHRNASGKGVAMKSDSGGMQLHVLGGFKNQYVFDVPVTGKYQLMARVATVQTGQKFQISANDAATPVEIDVPYTLGMWDYTKPIEVTLAKGENTLHFESMAGSKGASIKDFMLKPIVEAKNPQWPWWLALCGLLLLLILVAALRKHGRRTRKQE